MPRILVVDDSAVMRRNLVFTLTKAGHEVVAEGSDGGQAVHLYKTHSPDLVTMDITMPEVNGIEAVKRVIKEFPKAKIVMVSALDQKEMVLEALRCGAKHYIIKPINPENLISVVNKVLGCVPPPPVTRVETVVVDKLEPIKETVEPEPDTPFMVRNVDSMFYIKLTKLLSIENVGSLLQAAQGLLYVQPLKVGFDFGKIEALPDEVLNKIAEIVNLMLGAHGRVTMNAQNDGFINSVKEKNIKGLTEFF